MYRCIHFRCSENRAVAPGGITHLFEVVDLVVMVEGSVVMGALVAGSVVVEDLL